MYQNPPEYAAVVDAMACQAVPVKLICSADAIYSNTVDGTATTNSTVTTTVINNATPGNAPGPCNAMLNAGPVFITDDMPIADAMLVQRGSVRLVLDNDDEPLIDDDSIYKYLACTTCQIAGQPTAALRVIPGIPMNALQQQCPLVFTTRDTLATLTTNFPTGFAETFTQVTILRQWEYSTQDRRRCWLTPGVYEPSSQQIIPINACAEAQLAPPTVVGGGIAAAAARPGYGIQYGMEQGPFGT